MVNFFLIVFSFLTHVWVCFSQSGDTVVIPSSKKSIFATSDASRVNSFIQYAFEPLIKKNQLVDLYFQDFTCGSPSKFRFDCGFEIHSPYTPYHASGGFEVEYLESQYAAKWLNLMSKEGQANGWYYDAILDNSMTFWVTDLADFDGYNEEHVDRLYLKWQWDGKTYYSMFIHNGDEPNDLNQFELISDKFSTKTSEELDLFKTSEPRAFLNEDVDYAGLCASSGYDVVAIGIRRAVSNVASNVQWYKTMFGATITHLKDQLRQGITIDANGNTVKYAHILLDSSDGFTVTFYERIGDKATFGELSILDMENGINEAHSQEMVNPFCCVDRWYDMHYAIPLEVDAQALGVLESVMRSGEIYLVYYNQIVDLTDTASIDDDAASAWKQKEIDDAGSKPINKHKNKNKDKNKDKNNSIRRLAGKINMYFNEDPSAEETVGMFWTLVEPNGQMVQVPGIVVDKSNWHTDSGSLVEMFIEPTYWDGEWCPMQNTKEFDSFAFGDDIARIVVASTDDDDDDDDDDTVFEKQNGNNFNKNKNKNKNGFVQHEYNREMDSKTIRYRLVDLMLLFIAVVVLILGCYNYNKSKLQSKFEETTNISDDTTIKSNKVEYTYKTFQ